MSRRRTAAALLLAIVALTAPHAQADGGKPAIPLPCFYTGLQYALLNTQAKLLTFKHSFKCDPIQGSYAGYSAEITQRVQYREPGDIWHSFPTGKPSLFSDDDFGDQLLIQKTVGYSGFENGTQWRSAATAKFEYDKGDKHVAFTLISTTPTYVVP